MFTELKRVTLSYFILELLYPEKFSAREFVSKKLLGTQEISSGIMIVDIFDCFSNSLWVFYGMDRKVKE